MHPAPRRSPHRIAFSQPPRLNDCAVSSRARAEHVAHRARITTWCCRADVPELPVKMALIAEPESHRYFRQRISLTEHDLRPRNPDLLEVLVWWQSGRVTKHPAQVKAAHARNAGQFGHACHSTMRMQDSRSRNFDRTLASGNPRCTYGTELAAKHAPYSVRQTLGDAAVGRLCALVKHAVQAISGLRVVNDGTDESNSLEINTPADYPAHGLRRGVHRAQRPTA